MDRGKILWGVGFLVCLLAPSGCVSFGEATAKGAVLGSYEGYQELKKRHEDLGVSTIVADPAFRAAARELTKAAVTGAADGYEEADIEKKADTLVRTMLSAAGEETNQAVGQLISDQGPQLQLIVRQTLTTSIRDAGAELRHAASTDGAAAVEAVMTAAIEALVRQMDPEKTKGIRQSVRGLARDAGAGLVAGLREELAKPETQLALADLSKSAANGARDGLLEDNGESKAIWTTAALLLGVLFLLSVVALVFYIRRSLLSGRALTVVAQQINRDAEGHADVAEMKERIRERAVRAGVEPHLNAFLKDRGL